MSEQRLCNACTDIVLDVTDSEIEFEIRRYNNIHELRLLALHCKLCKLIRETTKGIDHPDEGRYCKQSWGLNFFSKILDQTPILVYYRASRGEYNFFISILLDAQNTAGFKGGPHGFDCRYSLGGICVPKDSPFADRISGRPISQELGIAEQISLTRSFWQHCSSNHSECLPQPEQAFMPTRVLDLKRHASESRVCLLEVPPGLKAPYATLSYCWGDAQNLRLSRNLLLPISTSGVPLGELPLTIKEACELCLGLGIDYLWICSLCIFQDSESDWQEQSSVMDTIYNSSALTISAASSRHCASGLFIKDISRAREVVELKCQITDGPSGSCVLRASLEPGGHYEPTSRRGWTLQENLLSTRLITFGTYELSYQCRASQWNETGRVRKPTAYSQSIFPCPSLELPLHEWPERRVVVNSKEELWRALVIEYSGRVLSLEKDELPAISGIAKWLVKSPPRWQDEAYVAGLWRSQLPSTLLWYNSLGLPLPPVGKGGVTRPETYRAPSWSWACLSGNSLHWLDTKTQEDTAMILACNVISKSEDHFGQIQDATMDVRASMKRGWLVPTISHPESFEFWADNWRDKFENRGLYVREESLGVVFLDTHDAAASFTEEVDPKQPGVYSCDCLRLTTNAGLLIVRSQGRGLNETDACFDVRKRIGVVDFWGEMAESWWRDSLVTTVRLI